MDEHTEKPAVEPAIDFAVEPTEELVEEPIQEPAIEPTVDFAVEPTEELIEEHAEEPTEEPAASQVSESQNQHLESIPKLDLNTLQPEVNVQNDFESYKV